VRVLRKKGVAAGVRFVQQVGAVKGRDKMEPELISSYSRQQAIDDGMLIDLSKQPECREAGFSVPVAMTAAAWGETIAAGGTWKPDKDGWESMELPGGQSVAGRLWDVLSMLKIAIRRHRGPTDRVSFAVLVDTEGNGRHKRVDLYAVIGPGDTADPVMTIMLPNED